MDTTTISHRGHKHFLRKCAVILESSGYTVLEPERAEWIKVGDVCRIMSMTTSTVSAKLHSEHAPKYPVRLSPTGRILRLVLTPELKRFLAEFVNKS